MTGAIILTGLVAVILLGDWALVRATPHDTDGYVIPSSSRADEEVSGAHLPTAPRRLPPASGPAQTPVDTESGVGAVSTGPTPAGAAVREFAAPAGPRS